MVAMISLEQFQKLLNNVQKNIKILDCTLRDGGYVNDWMFGEKNIQFVMQNLASANIDYIECGFLKDVDYIADKAYYSTVDELIPMIALDKNYTLMVNFGEYDIKKFSQCQCPNIKIRVAFKKHNQADALNYIANLKKLGWDVFANPMITNNYSQDELENLINHLNDIKPFGVTIVDTLGNMDDKDIIRIFEFIDKKLDKEILLGFHSHNSLQLSFSNTKTLLGMNIERSLIIDSCLYGMGRGAGNLCTELIAKFLNDNFQTKYDITSIIKLIENIIEPIFQKFSWGYSTPFYLAAIHACHPNYAQALISKNYSDDKINEILQKIPEENKTIFDIKVIENICNRVIS